MGRRLTAAQLSRRLTITQNRERAIAARPRSVLTTVRKRSIDAYVYASYSIKVGSVAALFKLSASEAAVDFFGGAASLGLRLPSAITDPVPAVHSIDICPPYINAVTP